MELSHHFTVPASPTATWETFMDLAGVAECFPGATVTSVDGDSFTGTVKVKLGPIALLYAGSGTFVERDDTAHRAVLEAKGKDKRGNGTAGATVTIALTDGQGGGTAVDVATDLSVTGKPAQFGRGVMQDVSDKLLGQFVACLEQRLDAPAEAQPETPPSAEEPAPSNESPPPAESPPPDQSRRPSSTPLVAASAGGSGEALDLGATVLPVILRSYAPHLVVGVVGLAVGVVIGRSLRR